MVIWVYRRHAAYPRVRIGFAEVSDADAAVLIQDGCAETIKSAERLTYARGDIFTPDSDPKPAAGRRRTYKRRDMKAED